MNTSNTLSEIDEPEYNEKNSVALSMAKGLAREIGTSKVRECPYVLFLGAGASVSSGIPASGALIRMWQQEIFCDIYNKNYPINVDDKIGQELYEDFEKWISNGFVQWFSDTIGDYNESKDNMYSTLFECLRQSKESRQSFIEDIISNESVLPSVGYFYLASLLHEKIIGCVLTTNFDDLIADALFRFYDSRPIICAFESSISNFNNSSTRPKIIKLHGDYLFNDIRNTDSELIALDINMENKMIELCQDRGLVFLGYGGNDHSIMDPILKQMQVNPRFLTKDLHWCIQRSNETSGKKRSRILKKEMPEGLWLLKKRFPKRVHIYEVDSFDHFMCEIYSCTSTSTSKSTKQCFSDASERNVSKMFIKSLDRLRRTDVFHQQMSIDYENAADSLSEDSSLIDNMLLQAYIYWQNGKVFRDDYLNYSKAIEKFQKGVGVIDDAIENEKPNEKELLKLFNRKIACQIGITKSFNKLADKASCKKAVEEISTTENKIQELVKRAKVEVESAIEEYASLLYNLICAKCVTVSIKENNFDDIKETIDSYVHTLATSLQGREKIEKLQKKEADVEKYVAKIWSSENEKKSQQSTVRKNITKKIQPSV